MKNSNASDPVQTLPSIKLFAYGTLRLGEGSELWGYYRVMESEQGYVEGLDLFQVVEKWFPAVLKGKGRVHGVLMTFNGDPVDFWEKSDQYEGAYGDHPLYKRKTVRVHLKNGQTKEAYAYFWNPKNGTDESILKPVPSGKWNGGGDSEW